MFVDVWYLIACRVLFIQMYIYGYWGFRLSYQQILYIIIDILIYVRSLSCFFLIRAYM